MCEFQIPVYRGFKVVVFLDKPPIKPKPLYKD